MVEIRFRFLHIGFVLVYFHLNISEESFQIFIFVFIVSQSFGQQLNVVVVEIVDPAATLEAVVLFRSQN